MLSNNSSFIKSISHVLVENNIIQQNERISIMPCYKAITPDKEYSHFIIKCENSDTTLFLKSKKRNDCAIHCNKYLQNFKNRDGSYTYPVILVPTFTIDGQDYYITSYVTGDNLDKVSSQLSVDDWDNIAKELFNRLNELSGIKESNYSEKNNFVKDNYANIMIRKIESKFQHPVFRDISKTVLTKAIYTTYEILRESYYSVPSLIHMDIKPANIIWNRQTGTLSLVDFEFARFGDIDYGWVQLLLSGINRFTEEYRTILIPRIVNDHLSLKEAQKIPKYQCYIFYQTGCNLIYYYDRKLQQPQEFISLFHKMLTELSGDKK